MDDFKSMVEALGPYFDSPLADIPTAVLEPFGKVFGSWDRMSPKARRNMAEVYDLTHIATTQTVGDPHTFAGPQGVSLIPPRFDADHARLWGIEKRIKEIKTSISAYEPSTDIVKNREERTELDKLRAELAALELAALEPAIKSELVEAVPAPAGKRRHVYKYVPQSDAILATIKHLGEDPLKLPKAVGITPGIKSKVKKTLIKDAQWFASEPAFDYVWQEMRDRGVLRNA